MNLNNFLIHEKESIFSTLNKIESNHKGFLLIHNSQDKIIGIVTDGDIRRKLLDDVKLEDSVLKCTNFNFIKASSSTPRELLLKKLDNEIRFIPILDHNDKLLSIVTRDFFPETAEQKVFARSKSPVRISFGGGGSDVSSYFSENRAAVINATISLYTHSTLKIRNDDKIFLNSLDLNKCVNFDNLSQLLEYKGDFSLIQSVIKAIKPSFGFELFIHSDFPMSSGLGGSAVVTSSILGCFNQFRNDKWDKHDISEIAFQAERLHLGVAGGWQDQYATVFGGFNFMEFNKEQNIINPIRLNNDTILELEESLVLCYTGTTHDSGNIHNDQKEQTKNEDVKDRIQSNVDLTFEIRNHLLRGRLNNFGHCLHKAWELKKSFSSKISTPWLDEIYDGAIHNGAIGGKLLGAGGGGYFLFYVPSFDRHALISWIKTKGLFVTPFVFENNGLQSWTVRENL
jgi:D-glycero-alpha-D-manno-heptose-7-phosphate kinase